MLTPPDYGDEGFAGWLARKQRQTKWWSLAAAVIMFAHSLWLSFEHHTANVVMSYVCGVSMGFALTASWVLPWVLRMAGQFAPKRDDE